MANTYTQLSIQLVFAVKGRQSLIQAGWKEDLYRYITGIVQQHGHKMLRINGMPDHIHIFIGYNPNQLIPKLVEDIKTSSNQFINRLVLMLIISSLVLPGVTPPQPLPRREGLSALISPSLQGRGWGGVTP